MEGTTSGFSSSVVAGAGVDSFKLLLRLGFLLFQYILAEIVNIRNIKTVVIITPTFIPFPFGLPLELLSVE